MKAWLVIARLLWPAWVGSAGEASLCPCSLGRSRHRAWAPGSLTQWSEGDGLGLSCCGVGGWQPHLSPWTSNMPSIATWCRETRSHPGSPVALSYHTLNCHEKCPLTPRCLSRPVSLASLMMGHYLFLGKEDQGLEVAPCVQDTEAERAAQFLEMKLVLTDDSS